MVSVGYLGVVSASAELDTDSEPFVANGINTQSEIDAEFTDVDHPSGTYADGDPVRVTVTVENTGSEPNRFYLGFSVQDPDGEWSDGDDEASVYLQPGDQTTTDLIWYVDGDAKPGWYESRVSAWEESDPDNLDNRVADDGKPDAFDIEEESTEPESWPDSPDEELTITEGESVTFTVGAEHDDGDLQGAEWYVDHSPEDVTYGLSGSWDTDDWSRTFDDPGTYTVEADVFDSDDDYNHEAAEWTITVEEEEEEDTVPESWADSPDEAVTITEGESVNFVVGAEHDDGELRGAEWYVDHSPEDVTYGLSGSWDTDDWSRTFDDPGTYTVEADVFDSDDDYNDEAAEWTVTVEEEEEVRPESWPDSPDEEVTITEGESVNFVVGAEHDDGGLHGAEWYVDHSAEDVTYGLSGSWDTDDWSRTFDDPGTYTVEADVFDSDDDYNDEAAEWTVTVEEEEEDTVPESWADSPDEAVTITEGESVNFVVGAEHDDGELYGAEWYVDHSPEDVTYGLSGWSDTDDWSHTFEDPGTYTVEADVFDADDDYNDEAAEWTVTVEEEEEIVPESWADSPDEEVTITEGESVNFVVGAEHDDGGLHGAEWYVDHSAEDVTYGLSGSWDTDDWSRTFDDPGTYTVEADVFDSDDDYNHEAAEWTVTVEEETSDGTPTISRNDPVTASVVVDEGDTQEFEVELSDPDADLESLEWYVNGENEHTGDLGDDPLQTEDWSQTFDTPGEYTIEAVVTNDEGSTDAVSWNVSATEIQHEGPTIESKDPETQISTTPNSRVEFTITAESDTELSGIEWRVDNEVQSKQDVDGTTTREAFLEQFDEAGEYQVTAVVFDEHNEYSNSVSWSVKVEEPRPDGLTVEVVTSDGAPVSNAAVTLYGVSEGMTDNDGIIAFEEDFNFETRLVVDDGSEFSSEFRDVSPEQENIVVEVTQRESISVFVVDQAGDPVEDTTVSIKGSRVSGETDELGAILFDEELSPRQYELSIEGYESREIVVEPGEDTYTVQTQPSEENGLADARSAAFTRGAVCGDPCWNAGLYNSEHNIEYLSGWIGASFATPFADARDLGSAMARGDGTDAALAGLGVFSGVAATPKAVSKIKKFLGRYNTQSSEVSRLLLESRAIPNEVFYRGVSGAENMRGVNNDVLIRYLNEGGEIDRLLSVSIRGADNAELQRAVMRAYNDGVSKNQIDTYLRNVERAAQSNRISSEARLVEELVDNPGARQFWGQSGEVASAVRYADEGATVRVEPGSRNTDTYDLAVTRSGQTEYVEVKNRAPGSTIDENWVRKKIKSMNTKYENALSDPSLDVANKERVLEIRTNTNQIGAVQTEVQNAVEFHQLPSENLEADTIRLVTPDGTTETVQVTS